MWERFKRIWKTASAMFLPLVLVVLLAGVGYALLSSQGQASRDQIDDKLERTQAKIDRLERENHRLRMRIHSLQTSDRLVEKVAREDGNLIAPGDILYVFPEN